MMGLHLAEPLPALAVESEIIRTKVQQQVELRRATWEDEQIRGDETTTISGEKSDNGEQLQPPDIIAFSFLGGNIQLRRVAGQWYLSLLR